MLKAGPGCSASGHIQRALAANLRRAQGLVGAPLGSFLPPQSILLPLSDLLDTAKGPCL